MKINKDSAYGGKEFKIQTLEEFWNFPVRAEAKDRNIVLGNRIYLKSCYQDP